MKCYIRIKWTAQNNFESIGKSLLLLLANLEKPYSKKTLISKDTANDTIITNVVPADFDGDSQMDVLIARQKSDQSGPLSLQIYWGKTSSLGLDNPFNLPMSVNDEPLLVDANGDMVPDLLLMDSQGKRQFVLLSSRNYTLQELKNGTSANSTQSLPAFRSPSSSAFVDLNNDLTADLCIVSILNGVVQMEFWYNQEGQFVWNASYPVPGDNKVLGQATFMDIDGDNLVDVILPACEDVKCEKSVLKVLSLSEWNVLPINFNNWRFVRQEKSSNPWSNIPITVRGGDFNLDGYPDLLVVLETPNGKNSTQGAFLFENIGCNNIQCKTIQRSFSPNWNYEITKKREKAILPAFYDVQEDGILDIILTVTENNIPRLKILKHTFTEDACFVKIMVVSGLCQNDCPGGREPYGVNQYGPVARYKITTNSDSLQFGAATQLSQSAHFALQLPYTIFGLGQTPNFVDSMEVGISSSGKGSRRREWTQIIPNSQLIVIPHPLNKPQSWTNKLFVTPSKLVLLTGIALLGTCTFMILLVGVLQWRERVEDKKEKLQEAHRFHFDAM